MSFGKLFKKSRERVRERARERLSNEDLYSRKREATEPSETGETTGDPDGPNAGFNFANNPTISRDQSGQSNHDDERLLALRPPSAGTLSHPEASLSVHGLQALQKMIPGATRAKTSGELLRPVRVRFDHATSPQHKYRGTYETAMDPPSDASRAENADQVQNLLSRVRALELENHALKCTIQGQANYGWEVVHQVEDGSVSSLYVEEPGWAWNDSGSVTLRAKTLISNLNTYAQRKRGCTFVVVKVYRNFQEHAEKTGGNGMAQDIPRPVTERIIVVADDMKLAMAALFDHDPRAKVHMPQWNLRSRPEISVPYLFWYRFRSTPVADTIPAEHRPLLQLVTSYIQQAWYPEFDRIDAMLKRGVVSCRAMDYLVFPDDVIVSHVDGKPQSYVATQALVPKNKALAHITHDKDGEAGRETDGMSAPKVWEWKTYGWRYTFDGEFSKSHEFIDFDVEDSLGIDDEIPLESISVIPLRHFSNMELERKLERRGQLFWKFGTKRVVSYDGIIMGETCSKGDRFMIDSKTYRLLHPPTTGMKGKESGYISRFSGDMEPPSKPDIYVFPDKITAFHFRRKKWGRPGTFLTTGEFKKANSRAMKIVTLDVDNIHDVQWNRGAFENLVLDEDTKEIIQALVTNKLDAEKGTDLIQDKGTGLIMLLHGGPGTGKTFTAESVAELAEKPLYPVTCGDIGTNPGDVEKYLESVFHLGKIWGCVVLLDEADVFLEQRTLSDLERNSLVSVFLRTLEYYDGILILTSNRVGTFDEAFKSRIQLALHYEPLARAQRIQIWKNFFRRLRAMGEGNIDYGDVDEYYDDLAEHELNGRQIRNSITIARQLAQFKGKKMAYAHLRHSIKIGNRFDTYLKSVKEGYSDEQIARSEGLR